MGVGSRTSALKGKNCVELNLGFRMQLGGSELKFLATCQAAGSFWTHPLLDWVILDQQEWDSRCEWVECDLVG